MSITALVTGRLLADPEQRTGASGKAFTTARLAADGEGDSFLVSVIAFGTAAEALAALTKGDTASIAGRSKPKAWTSKEGELRAGLDVVAEQVMSVYGVRRKRAAAAGDAEPPSPGRSARVARSDKPQGQPRASADDEAWLQGETT